MRLRVPPTHRRAMRAYIWLEQQPKSRILAGMVALVALVGWTDYATGVEIAFSVFYFLPIAGAAYLVGLRAGIGVAIVCAVVWLIADVAGGHTYASTAVGVWNTLNRLLSFLVLASLLGALRQAYEHQQEMARTDGLTGARNRRRFHELVETEIGRCRRFRRPFTVMHFDLDGFKTVNDRLGHVEGDEVLRAVVDAAQGTLRATDSVARLGGDEFAILLPETGAEAARQAAAKLQAAVGEAMRKHEWPVSVSLGVLTCIDAPADADELMRLADALTYRAKNEGRNTAVYDVVAARLVSVASPAGRGAPADRPT